MGLGDGLKLENEQCGLLNVKQLILPKEELWFIASAKSCGVNIPAMLYFKLPT